MICADLETSTAEERRLVAERAFLNQVQQVSSCIFDANLALSPFPAVVVLSGVGEFLAEFALAGQKTMGASSIISLSREMGPDVSKAACAYALAVLAAEDRS